MFCAFCGSELPEGTKFCSVCGADLTQSNETEYVNTTSTYANDYTFGVKSSQFEPTTSKKGLKVGAIIAIAAAVAAVCVALVLLLLPGGGYKDYNDLIDDYYTASSKANCDDVKDLVHSSVIDYYELLSYSETEMMCDIDEWYEDGYYGMEVTAWYISDVDSWDYDDCQEIGYILDIEIEKAIDVEVCAIFQGDSDCYDFDLIQVDGRWYLLSVW